MASFKSDGKTIFMIFVGAIITVVFLGLIANAVFTQTNLETFTNVTVTTAQVNESVTLTGRSNTTVVTVVNASDGTDWTANFSVTTLSSAGIPGIFLVTSQNGGEVGQNVTSANVTYTSQPQGYLQDSGTRSVAALVVIFGALAIVVFVIVVIFKFGSIKEMVRNFR
jgi:hypothetical protein